MWQQLVTLRPTAGKVVGGVGTTALGIALGVVIAGGGQKQSASSVTHSPTAAVPAPAKITVSAATRPTEPELDLVHATAKGLGVTPHKRRSVAAPALTKLAASEPEGAPPRQNPY